MVSLKGIDIKIEGPNQDKVKKQLEKVLKEINKDSKK